MKDKSKNRLFIPIIHILLTFAFERLTLIPDRASEVSFSVPLNDIFSLKFEQIMCYGISKIMAVIIIVVLWKLVFYVFDGKLERETFLIFGIILAIYLILTVLEWPDNFVSGGDNYIPYSFAIRLVPEYWHSIYLSCLYTACMMVFPHAISIVLFQCTLFVVAVGSVFHRISISEKLSGVRWIRFVTLAFFFFRDTFNVRVNPERAEINVSFLLIYVSLVTMDILEKKVRSKKEFVILMITAGFLSVYRSEGLIVGLLGFVALIVFVYKPEFKKGLAYCVLLIVCFLIFKLPTKVGEIKYYGRDYSIINTFSFLRNVLNAEDANLEYDGVISDLNSITAVTPIVYIAKYGSDGYRMINYYFGRLDFNQSAADSDTAKAYMKAYKSLVKHNLPIYLKTQWYMLLSALHTGIGEYVEPFSWGEEFDFPMFGKELWAQGMTDVTVARGYYFWTNLSIRVKLISVIDTIRQTYYSMLTKLKIYSSFVIAEFLLSVYIVLASLISVAKGRDENLAAGISAFILDGYFVLMSLAMPVGANMYFHAYIYSMFVLILIFFGCKAKNKKLTDR